MSTRIVIEFETKPEKKCVEVQRRLEGDKPNDMVKKLMGFHLLGLARGLAEQGIAQNAPFLLDSSAKFVEMACDVYAMCTEEERKA